MNIDDFELTELLLRAYGYSEKETTVEQLNKDFDIDEFLTDIMRDKDAVLNFVHDLVSRLMPFCFMGQSPLTKKGYQGFAEFKNGMTTAIAKIEVKL